MSMPAATRIGARSQPLPMPRASIQSPSSSSASAVCTGVSSGALALRSIASSCAVASRTSTSGSTWPEASALSLCRIFATRSRSDEVARTAAAAGLFSSCVSPADRRPRESSRSRSPMIELLRRMPRYRPSSRCIAIGNQPRMAVPRSSESSTKKVQSVTASRLLWYSDSLPEVTNAVVAPE